MSFFKRNKTRRIDLEKIDAETDATLKVVVEQEEHVNKLSAYLTWRNGENNFGNDFDVAFQVRRPVAE